MKIQEFNDLKVGNVVYLNDKDGTASGREVTEIDRFFKKVKFVGNGRWVTYRRTHKKTKNNVTSLMGMSRLTYV